MSALYLRRSVRRAFLRAVNAELGAGCDDIGMPSPMIEPVVISQQYHADNDFISETQDWVEHRDAYEQDDFSWPCCPIQEHHDCPAARYYYAGQYPSQQQCQILVQGGFGLDFFEYTNPPPQVWASLHRVLNGETNPVFLNLIFAYRFHHCARRRAELLEAKASQFSDGNFLHLTPPLMYAYDGSQH